MMSEIDDRLKQLHQALDHKQLNPLWAKLEIVFGLLASGIGLFFGFWVIVRSPNELDGLSLVGALILFVFGGYLALAGSRSHLYQSNNRLTAYLADMIRKLNDKG
jgi:hypothetical protein